MSRRAFLQLAGASTVGGALAACSPGSSGTGERTIRLGYISPQSGPLVSFGEADAFVLDDVRARLRDGLSLGRRSYPVEVLVKDSQSDPERAATVANDLLRRERIDPMLASSTPETTNPVADVCEQRGVPCITTFTPWQSYFFGREGDPAKPFRWTYHFYWGLEDVIQVFTDMWGAVPTNKRVGALTPPIPAGRAARTAWRRLDRQTKAEVLRRAAEGQGHPDPEVAAVAVGFARWELHYPRWVQVAIVLGLLLVAVFLDSLSPRPPIPIVTITLLVALVILWRARRSSRAKLERMERANLAVLGGEATATGDG